MKNKRENKTIAAIATPAGTGGISVIRVSGKDALEISLKILKAEKKAFRPQFMFLTTAQTVNINDEVMAVYFRAPKSYTGEDVVEIHCHGSGFITNEILNALIKNGCRAAENGEFTKRAFLNGRLDLSAAEGVIDLINSESAAQIKAAFAAVKGKTYKKIDSLQEKLLSMCASIGAAVDYPEEGLEEETKEVIEKQLSAIIDELTNLKNGYECSKPAREGVKVTIAGVPNTGKSTLLNALIGYDRAIITDKEGTTRDTLEESFLYKDIKFIFTDTAGLRETSDEAERLGVLRSREAVKTADIVLSVHEYGKNNDITVYEEFKGKCIIEVINKIDKLSDDEKKSFNNSDSIIYISAKSGENIDALKELMLKTAYAGKVSTGGEGINNARQLSAVINALDAVISAKENLKLVTLDFILSDLNEARRSLGLINGRTASDEVVNEIFSRFCVGK